MERGPCIDNSDIHLILGPLRFDTAYFEYIISAVCMGPLEEQGHAWHVHRGCHHVHRFSHQFSGEHAHSCRHR
ncbi:hypothetical protein BC834DRAFT_910577 [Gloeopeniophorella convolvens]|nr:hypothetical protein BC834DRAFT_910577 [Gloeopeniophorella convolvens]